MKLRRLTTTAMMLVAAMGIGAGVSAAQPAAEPAPDLIDYMTNRDGNVVQTQLFGGVFTTTPGEQGIEVRDGAGNLVTVIPSFIRLDNLQFPLLPEISEDGSILRLTPDMRPEIATEVPAEELSDIAAVQTVELEAEAVEASEDEQQLVVGDISDELADVAGFQTKEERDAAAMKAFSTQLSLTMSITSVLAAIIGGAVGCAVGLIPGTALTLGLTPILGIGTGLGVITAAAMCAAGALMISPMVSLTGTIVVGAAALAIYGVQYFNQINAPFVPAAVPAEGAAA
jgi:hypothetical protein